MHDIRSLKPNDYNLKYKEGQENEEYRVSCIKELINIQQSELEVPGFEGDALKEILGIYVSSDSWKIPNTRGGKNILFSVNPIKK